VHVVAAAMNVGHSCLIHAGLESALACFTADASATLHERRYLKPMYRRTAASFRSNPVTGLPVSFYSVDVDVVPGLVSGAAAAAAGAPSAATSAVTAAATVSAMAATAAVAPAVAAAKAPAVAAAAAAAAAPAAMAAAVPPAVVAAVSAAVPVVVVVAAAEALPVRATRPQSRSVNQLALSICSCVLFS
jgi:hypothetical protein